MESTQSQASKSPTGNNTSKKRKTAANEKKIADDEFMAAAIGDAEWLKQSVKANRGNVTFDKNGLAPIHLAAIHGRVDCLRLLVEKFSVDVNLGSTTGWRPAHLCISNQTGKRAYQCLAYLLEKNADPSIANDDNITPMHQAASEGHVQCLKALIEAGGSVTSKDTRGHTPLDLAKLWGHRKCARLLANEKWQQEKKDMENEMQKLRKIKLQQILENNAEEEEYKEFQEVNGEKAFQAWLLKNGLDEGHNGPPQTRRENKLPVQKPVKSGQQLYKANSYQNPGVKQNVSSTILDTNEPTKPPDETYENSTNYGESAKTRAQTEMPDQSEVATQNLNAHEGLWYNPDEWVKSTKIPGKEYIANLPDHYPHDEYTMKPKYPPKRQRPKSGTKQNIKLPDLPKDVINKTLHPEENERPVVYKCKHIEDVHKRMHFDVKDLPKPEVALHLADDLSSLMFKAGLQVDTLSLMSKPRAVKSDSSSSSLLSMENLDPLLVHKYKRLSKPQKFPNIKGKEYAIGSHG